VPYGQITDGKYLTRNTDFIVNELSEIEEKNICFADDESMLKAERMLDLAKKIQNAGIRKEYRLLARATTIVKNPQLFEKWKEVGLQSVVVGFEAFTSDDLKKIGKKGSTIAINESAISILKQNGIEICADFIVTQDFDREKFKQLSDYVKSHGLQRVVFPVLTPLPGTKLFEQTKDKILIHDYDFYDFKHTLLPTKLPLEEFYNEFVNLHYLMFPKYRRPLYRYLLPITKYLPTFRSGYEALKGLKNISFDYD